MKAMVEEEKNIAALKQALEMFNANAERLYSTHEALRKRVQELTAEVQTLKSRLENVLASISDAVIVIDSDRKITLANPAAAEYGLVVSMPLDRAFNGNAAGLLQEISQALTRAHNVREITANIRGVKKVFSVSVAALQGPESSVSAGAVLSFRDITEITKLREDLERKERLASLGEMAAAIAHEVRNPLGGLRLYAGLAANAMERRDFGTASQHFRSITNGISEIDATIENVLTFARDMEVHFAPVQLCSVIGDAIEELNGLFDDYGAVIESRIPEDLVIRADGRLLRRAIANLIDNAVKIQEHGGQVEVWHEINLAGDEPALSIIIGDRGPGVKQEEAEQWFLPFRTGRAEGTGLGLAIVERIAEAHGGTAMLRPRDGGGAEAVILLPAKLIVSEAE